MTENISEKINYSDADAKDLMLSLAVLLISWQTQIALEDWIILLKELTQKMQATNSTDFALSITVNEIFADNNNYLKWKNILWKLARGNDDALRKIATILECIGLSNNQP